MPRRVPHRCAFCAATEREAVLLIRVGGWLACPSHKVAYFLLDRPSPCHYCYAPIHAGHPALLTKIGGRDVLLHVPVECGSAVRSGRSGEVASSFRALHLTSDAPMKLVKAAQRVLANLYHPDRLGGDAERMKMINNAADEILRRNRWRR